MDSSPCPPSSEAGTVKRRRTPISSLTTAGKIAKAQAKIGKTKKAARRTASGAKPKPRSLPPPAEYAALNKLDELPKKSSNRKPLTNKEKILAAEISTKAKEKIPLTSASKARTKIDDAGKKDKQRAAKIPGLFSQLNGYDATAIRYETKKSAKNAVMYRRTQKAERFLRERRDKALADPETKALWDNRKIQAVVSEAGMLREALDTEMGAKLKKLVSVGLIPAPMTGEAFRLMDLPTEVREMVWKLVVVETKFFIWPDSVTGREQPDLAMVSQQIRGEVLPIFYGENTFAVDLSPFKRPIPRRGEKATLTGLPAIKKWAERLAESGAFRHIKKWAFDYNPQTARPTGKKNPADSSEKDGSFMISMELQRPKEGTSWSAELEIHREAHCVISKNSVCRVRSTPAWLNDVVYRMLDTAAEHGRVSPGLILSFAKAVVKKVHELPRYACAEVNEIRSDTDSAFGGD